MGIRKTPINSYLLNTDNHLIERVQKMKYLDCCLNDKSGADAEVKTGLKLPEVVSSNSDHFY